MMTSLRIGSMVIMFALLCAGVSAQAETATTYNRIDEIMDWGAVTTKLIVDLKAGVPQGAVKPDSFTVHVVGRDERLKEPYAYTITQKKAIGEIAGDLVTTKMGQYTRPLVDRFEIAAASYKDEAYGQIDMNYAHYRPARDNKKHPRDTPYTSQ